jgi:hypothetical protein
MTAEEKPFQSSSKYVSPEKRKSGQCGVCGTKGKHKYHDYELRSPVCHECIQAAVHAERFLVVTCQLSRPTSG